MSNKATIRCRKSLSRDRQKELTDETASPGVDPNTNPSGKLVFLYACCAACLVFETHSRG